MRESQWQMSNDVRFVHKEEWPLPAETTTPDSDSKT